MERKNISSGGGQSKSFFAEVEYAKVLINLRQGRRMDAEVPCGVHAYECDYLPLLREGTAHRRAFRRLFGRRYFLLDADEPHGGRALRPGEGGFAAPERAVYPLGFALRDHGACGAGIETVFLGGDCGVSPVSRYGVLLHDCGPREEGSRGCGFVN